MKSLVAVAIVVLVALIAISGPARAEHIVVIDAADIGYPAGTEIPGGVSIAVPAGRVLSLIDDAGLGVTVKGPWQGPIRAQAPSSGRSVIEALKAIVAPAGGVTVGAARTLAPGQKAEPPDPASIDMGSSGTVCFDPAGSPRLWLDPTAAERGVWITLLATGETQRVVWRANQSIADWPAAVPVENGQRYLLQKDSEAAPRQILLKSLHPEPGIAGALALAQAGCLGQARALLETIALSGSEIAR